MFTEDNPRQKVKKLRRHRSLERQRPESQSSNIIHARIRPINDTSSAVTTQTSSTARRKPRRSVSVTSLRRDHQLGLQQSRNKSSNNSWNRIAPQKDDHSIKTANSFKSSKIISNNDRQNLCTFSSHSDQIGTIKDHHRPPNEKKKKKCSNLCKILSLVIGIVVIISTITIVLTIMLIKPQTTTSSTNLELRWNASGITVAGITGQTGVEADRLNSPFSVAIDYLNTLYITDYGCNRIQRWLKNAKTGSTIAGHENCSFGTNLSRFIAPSGILIDSDSNLYIADSGNSRILFWPKDATSGRIIAGDGTLGNASNQLHTSFGISRDLKSNELYVADYQNHRIMRYTLNAVIGYLVAGGNGLGLNSTQLLYPTNVYFESFSNSLLIVSHFASNVVRWKIGDDHWNLVAGSANQLNGMTSTLLDNPIGIAVDPMGNIYIADGVNHRIQLFLSGQSIGITIAGITGVHGDNATLLSTPYGVALDNQLNLYVVDTSNHRVQKFLRY